MRGALPGAERLAPRQRAASNRASVGACPQSGPDRSRPLDLVGSPHPAVRAASTVSGALSAAGRDTGEATVVVMFHVERLAILDRADPRDEDRRRERRTA